GRANILVGKTRAAIAGAQGVTRQAIIQEGHGRAGGAVIDLAHAVRADRQRRRSGVRRGRGRGVGGVVGRIRACHRNAADAHALGCARVFVGETGAAVAGAQGVARHTIIRQRHRRVGVAVIHFIRAGGGDRERARGDVGGGAGRGVGGVVGRISAADCDAVDAHRLRRPTVFIGKTGAAVAGAQNVATEAIVGERYRRAARPVISPVHTRSADR